jgi:hypothetical protein
MVEHYALRGPYQEPEKRAALLVSLKVWRDMPGISTWYAVYLYLERRCVDNPFLYSPCRMWRWQPKRSGAAIAIYIYGGTQAKLARGNEQSYDPSEYWLPEVVNETVGNCRRNTLREHKHEGTTCRFNTIVCI